MCNIWIDTITKICITHIGERDGCNGKELHDNRVYKEL